MQLRTEINPLQIPRPNHLPDFGKPPLNEVVVGVQFSPPKGYQQIRAGEVWALFKSDYPMVQEHQALEPAFETFGLPQHAQIAGRLSLVTGAFLDRFWFLRNSGDELIQFQHDRLLHNWRKVGDQTNEYPRFERMTERFGTELRRLEGYLASLSSQALDVHSHTFPAISRIPVSLVAPAGNRPTGVGPLPQLSSWLACSTVGGSLPHGYRRGFFPGPRAANSHSASVGNRPPAHRQ